MNDNTIDQTGYGFGSGGFAPSPIDSANARRNKAEMDRMSDFMQKLDPKLNQILETMARTQVRNGASPEEARRAAFGSMQGQLMSDGFLGLRRSGFLGQGDPINTGRNFLQGVSGGGFSMNVMGPGGSIGMNQSVMGGGLISGLASQQLAKDVMANIYGAGKSNPSSAFGFNMEDTSGVFRTMAQRGALGNIGNFRTYSDDKNSADYKSGARAVNDKLDIARRQEVDKTVLAALEGTTASNIDARIKEALAKGDKQIADTLGTIKTGNSAFALNDKNTKRVAELTQETIKGLANLKDVYGELSSGQLLAKMEAITGISISNKDEARRAAKMTSSITNMATATGNDPRAIQEMMIMRQGQLQAALAGRFGAELGQGGSSGGIGKELTGAVQRSIALSAMANEASARSSATDIEQRFGVKARSVSREDFFADTERQTMEYAGQNTAMVMMSGQGQTTLRGDKAFQRKRRELEDRMARAKTPGERAAINREANDLIRSRYGGKGASELMETAAGQEEFKSADWQQVGAMAGGASAMAVRNDRSDAVIAAVMGAGGSSNQTISEAFKRMGRSGVMKLADAKGNRLAGNGLQAELDKMVANGTLSQSEADAMRAYIGKASDAQYKENVASVSNSTAAGRSYHDTMIATAEADARTNEQQRSAFSDGKDLSLKSIVNAILSDKDNRGFDTSAKQVYALEALKKAGLGGSLKMAAKVNFDNGVDAEEWAGIRKASGDANFSIHDTLGFNTEADMLAATRGADGAKTVRQMRHELDKETSLQGGGTSSDYGYLNTDSDEVKKRGEFFDRYQKAIKMGQLGGVAAGDTTPAMREYIETGKVSKGSLGFDMEVDGKQRLYDEFGDSGVFGSDGTVNKVHFKNAGKMADVARRVNSKEEGADMLEMNALSGDSMLKGMEAQLAVMKEAKGAAIIDTTGSDGKTKETLDMATTIKSLEEAISKMKGDAGKTQVVQHMTVTNMYRKDE